MTILPAIVSAAPPPPAAAGQGITDLTSSATDYAMYAAAALAFLAVFYVCMIIIRRISGARQDPSTGVGYIDATALQRQGLLTPEELARVRQAMTRQVERKLAAERKPRRGAGELALLADPEVQRLEEEARLKAQSRAESQITPATPSQAVSPPAENRSDQKPRFAPRSSISRTAPEPLPSPAIGDVQLPPDVIKMAEAGLITPEEIEKIKQRISQKHQS